jgi:hypothetical protein
MRKTELKEINGADGYKAFMVKCTDSTGHIYDLKIFSTERKAQNYLKKIAKH